MFIDHIMNLATVYKRFITNIKTEIKLKDGTDQISVNNLTVYYYSTLFAIWPIIGAKIQRQIQPYYLQIPLKWANRLIHKSENWGAGPLT